MKISAEEDKVYPMPNYILFVFTHLYYLYYNMYKTIIHRPNWRQILICILPHAVLTGLLLGFSTVNIIFVQQLLLYAGMAMFVYTGYLFMYYTKMEYIITEEQLIFLHGVFRYTTDYMELYRVVDYQQSQSPLQILTNVKTVTIMSGDRNMSVLHIIGLKKNEDAITVIRERVEFNKRRKSIYEITNR